MSIAATRRSLIVAGATGAIGREVVVQAVSDARFGRVVALSRRTLTPNQFADTFPGIDAAKAAEKLSVVGVDWEALTVSLTPAAGCHRPASVTVPDESFPEGVRAAFANIDCAAMCMGTTKKDAGSAEAFVRVDFDYVVTFISLLRRFSPTSVTRYVQISSSGASATSYFLYMKTKGRADEAAVAAGFPHVVIMRPGLLGRKDKARFGERILSVFLPVMPVERVAAATMVAICDATGTTSEGGTVAAWENGKIHVVTPGWAPQPSSAAAKS